MPKVSPWHASSSAVHHNNKNCTTGNNIERGNRRKGDGGKRLCAQCARLATQGK